MVKGDHGRQIDGDIEALREHFNYASGPREISSGTYDLSEDSDLTETAEAIIRMIPYLSEDEAEGVFITMLIIVNGTAAALPRKYYANRIIDILKERYPVAYKRKKDFLGY